jgi:hypothetical protein
MVIRKLFALSGIVAIAILTIAAYPYVQIDAGKIYVVDGRIQFAPTATGGTITTNGGYIIHTFTNVGSTNFVVSGGSLACEVLIVAGGGGGGSAGAAGGGAGGLIYTQIVFSAGTSAVTIGASGAAGNSGHRTGYVGGDSIVGSLVAYGGGGGGGNDGGAPPVPGGSGGGGSYNTTGAIGTNGQGNAGGTGGAGSGAGGGGAGGQGQNGGAGAVGGNGGVGLYFAQFATVGGSPAGWFAGGGVGYYGTDGANGGTNTYGGGAVWGQNAAANTGGGGVQLKTGGSGIVIVRYPAPQ